MSTLRINRLTPATGDEILIEGRLRYTDPLPGYGGGAINHIGIAGQQGFGLGICPGPLPAGMVELSGTRDPASDNYGNYQYSDGSIMCWIPAFYMKWGTGSNGVAVNDIDIKPFSAYSTVAAANSAGYSLPLAFRNAGAAQQGVFMDKYLASNNGGIASSLRLGNPLSAHADHNPIAALANTPPNTLGGTILAAKSRGSSFFCATHDIRYALACLAYAHARAATSNAWCAWYDAAGVTNFPKGCNNNALGDSNDAMLAFVSDGYSTAAKTGSANLLARTAHNGQMSGVIDLNGCMWETSPGLTSDGTSFYVLKTSVDKRTLTGGNTLATDLFGATGLTANYDLLGETYGPLLASSTTKRIGLATQTFSAAVSGLAFQAASAGIPLGADATGTNAFGVDGLWDYRPNELCPRAGGDWSSSSSAGVWAVSLSGARGSAANSVGFRAALYL